MIYCVQRLVEKSIFNKCIVCSFIINVWASQASMFGVAAESAKGVVGLTGGGWVF